MTQASGADPMATENESLVQEAVSAAEITAANTVLGPLEMQFYLERFPFLQVVDSGAGDDEDFSKVTFEQAESGWSIHCYGDLAMSTSAGSFLFADGASVAGVSAEEAQCVLHLREGVKAPQTIYAWLGKPLTLKVVLAGACEEGARVTIADLSWEAELTEGGTQTFTLTPEKTGCFAINYPAGQFCGQLLVLEAPKELPKTGTLYHQSDVTAERLVQCAVEKGWQGIDIVDGSMRMKLAAWVAAKALSIPVVGVDNEDACQEYYNRIKEHSGARLKQLVEGTNRATKGRQK
jgi:hypothetical protein